MLINQSLYKLIDNVYDSSYSALSQSKCEKDGKDTMLLSIIHEMCLCFFWIYSTVNIVIISMFSVDLTFKVMFISSIVVLIVNGRLIKKWNV